MERAKGGSQPDKSRLPVLGAGFDVLCTHFIYYIRDLL